MDIRKLNFSPRKFLKLNFKIILILSLTNIIGLFGHTFYRLPFKLDSLFVLNYEKNIPTLYSGFLLIIASILLLILYFLSSNKNYFNYEKCYFLFLSIIFFFLSYDELFQMHEKLIEPVRNYFNLSGFFHFASVLPYALAVFIIALISIPFILQLPRNLKFFFLISGFLYISGELGLELIGSKIHTLTILNPNNFSLNFLYNLVSTIEETLALLGINLFNYSLLKLIIFNHKYLQLNLIDDK